MNPVKILLSYDDAAGVWTATSEDVPGLVLESGSIDALIERVKIAVPELLELNNLPSAPVLAVSAYRTVAVYG